MDKEKKKEDRQNTIEKLVSESEFQDQESILSKLEESGHRITQATLSRDLSELGISKIGKHYSVGKHAKKRVLREQLQDLFSQGRGKRFDIDIEYKILQYRTDPAYAPAICASIERLYEKEGVGAVSGITGTILITVPTNKKSIRKELENLFEEE